MKDKIFQDYMCSYINKTEFWHQAFIVRIKISVNWRWPIFFRIGSKNALNGEMFTIEHCISHFLKNTTVALDKTRSLLFNNLRNITFLKGMNAQVSLDKDEKISRN